MMVFWDQLTASATGVCYALVGVPGLRKFRATWSGTCQTDFCTSKTLNFTVVLDERTQRISFTYGAMTSDSGSPDRARGSQATVGIVNHATGCLVGECTPATGLCGDGTPCGYSQVFSNMVQTNGVQNVGFEPIFDSP